jgi:hypothetical protein
MNHNEKPKVARATSARGEWAVAAVEVGRGGPATEPVGDDEEPPLLARLVVGQSVIIDWSGEEAVTYIEEVVRCLVCGEALSESRLAMIAAATHRCPACGRAPAA